MAWTACSGAHRGSRQSSLLLNWCTCRRMYANEALHDDVWLVVLTMKHVTNLQLPTTRTNILFIQCSSHVHLFCRILIQFSTSARAGSKPPFLSDPISSIRSDVPRLVLQLLVHQLLLWVYEEIPVIIAVALPKASKASKPQALIQILLMPQLPQRSCGCVGFTQAYTRMYVYTYKCTWTTFIEGIEK